MDQKELIQLKNKATELRIRIVDMIWKAQSGHPGGSLSVADFMTACYFKYMNVDPKNPRWADRDRFVLSKGHVCPAQYAALAMKGFFPLEVLDTLRKEGSPLQGHPSMNKCPGIDISTGSLGQGLACAVGMALNGKITGKDYRVYSVLGDGEIQEGQVWEAAMFASHKKLDNLTIFIDNNNLQIDGTMEEVNSPYPIPEKFAAFGWNTVEIDGHDFDQIEDAIAQAKSVKDKPTAVIMHTVKGKGVSFMENQVGWHGVAPNAEQYENAMNELKTAYSALEAE